MFYSKYNFVVDKKVSWKP